LLIYYILAAERARSTSRRRGLDDPEPLDRSGLTSSYQTFSSPTTGHTTVSSHSSPGSANPSSPPMAPIEEPPEASPSMSAVSPYSYTTPISPVHAASPSRFEYDYGIHPSSLQSVSQPWTGNGHGEERRGLDVYSNGAPETSLYPNAFGFPPSLDPTYPGYEGSPDLAMTGVSTTPPSSSFAAPGLPFRGLDYIRNYNPGGYSADQDSLWQSYDPGAFGLDPDLPFTLGDTLGDIHHHP